MKFLFDISGHGYGHLAQISPVIRETHRRFPKTEILVRSAINPAILSAFTSERPKPLGPPPDIGLIMTNAYTVDLRESLSAYKELHRNFKLVNREQAEILDKIRPDVLISDVGYVGVAAALLARIPAYAACSLHWGEVFNSYFGNQNDANRIHEEILDSYSMARSFFLLSPRVSIPDIRNVRPVGLMGRYWGKTVSQKYSSALGWAAIACWPHIRLAV